MDDPSYLLPIAHILSDSLRVHTSVSLHDLLDAYVTFTNRIRPQVQLLCTPNTLLAALVALETHKDDFIRALRRDVRLAHIDPLDETSFQLKQYARDASSLCHHALCVLATILRFPAFYSVFSQHDLATLFDEVLDIALADHLPVLNKAKTYSLSLWSLTCHRLPSTVLTSRRDPLFFALERSLDRATQPTNVVLDGIKAISHTIQHHPLDFLYPLSPLLPQVITNLHCESAELSLHTSIALGNFAIALISHSDLSLSKWQTLSDHILPFLESHYDESHMDTVCAAFAVESNGHPADAPTSIISVLASLIVLCGPTLYSKPTVLRFILHSIAIVLTHKRSVIRALYPHVWRCFLWTFRQMLLSPDNLEPALLSSAFYILKQELSGGIGFALVNILLSDCISTTRSDRVSQALSVIEAMVQSDCKHTRREGFIFLQAFTIDTQVRREISQNMYEIPASVLLNGEIIGAEWDNLPSIIHSIPKVPIIVHWLEETEIAYHHKTLLLIWKHFATRVDKNEINSSLVDVWSSILRAYSHQLEYGQHSPTTTETLISSATTIVDFLPSVLLGECQPDWGSWNVHDQLSVLAFIDQLWFAMRKAFVSSSLTETAELILTSILKYAFHVLDLDVGTLWGRLCADLMVTASPSFLRDVHDLATSQLVVRSQRDLWGVIATSLSSSGLSLDWKELVKFLAIPTCMWVLSAPELRVWGALLRNSITVSGDSASVTEILQYFQGKEVENWESILPVLGFLFTFAHEHGNSPTDGLLSMLNVCLTVSYSRARHSPEALIDSLEILSAIRSMIISAPGEVMYILQALCSSLCLWIEDHAEVMSNDEFNSVAVSLYCEALKALELLPLSIQSLQDMEIFIVSAFSRIPTPAIAPFAFEKFWRATYHGRSQFCNILPPKIKSCLVCFVAAYGGDLADGLSLTTESQSQSISGSFQFTSHQYQDSGGHNCRVSPLSISMHAEGWPEVSDVSGPQQTFRARQDTTFNMSFPNDDALQPTVLRQLQEYSSGIDASSADESERSTSGSQTHFPSTFSPGDSMPSLPSPEKNDSVIAYTSNQKRKLADSDAARRKRSQTSRDTLRAVRKLESEPATRNVTPIDVLRMNSVPHQKRMVFDGVQVPTFREVMRRQKTVQRAKPSKNPFRTEQDLVVTSYAPSSHSTQKARRTSSLALLSSVGSDENNFDWENCCVDGTPPELDVNQSPENVHPNSALRIRASTPRGMPEYDRVSHSTRPDHSESDDEPCLFSGSKAMSQNEVVPSSRPSLRMAKTTSTGLGALQDVYSSVANGASQIPMSELLQATRLVHQIGAVLTEQMGKKMGGPGGTG